MPSIAVTAEQSATTQRSGESKDVFISYSKSDREWVKESLLGPLEKQAGLKAVIDYRDFPKGRLTTENIERAIKTCRCTVAVVSEASLASSWVGRELELIINADPDARKGKLIPLLKDGDLPARISMINAVDFRDLANRDQEFANLCKALSVSPKKLDTLATRSVSKGLEALFELMQTPEVHKAAGDFRDAFRETSKQIESVTQYKELHDRFQAAENSYGHLFLQRQRLRIEETIWYEVENYAEALSSDLDRVTEYAGSAGFRPDEVLGWPRKLERALASAREAIEQEDQELLGRALQKMHQVFGTVPSHLNERLVDAAAGLPLDALAGKLELIRDRLANVQFQQAAESRLEEVRRGIVPLKRLNERLRLLVTNHHCLQSIDNELRLHGDFPIHVPDGDEIRDFWVDLCDSTRALCSEDGASWIETLMSTADALDVQVAQGKFEADEEADKAICSLFRKYWSNVKKGFQEVNVDLKTFCSQLKEVGTTLQIGIAGLQR